MRNNKLMYIFIIVGPIPFLIWFYIPKIKNVLKNGWKYTPEYFVKVLRYGWH